MYRYISSNISTRSNFVFYKHFPERCHCKALGSRFRIIQTLSKIVNRAEQNVPRHAVGYPFQDHGSKFANSSKGASVAELDLVARFLSSPISCSHILYLNGRCCSSSAAKPHPDTQGCKAGPLVISYQSTYQI